MAVIYISASDIEVLNARIKERFLLGEHFVRPDIVKERYINGLNLLNHYFDKPNRLQLLDNSVTMQLAAEIESGKIINAINPLPFWIEQYLGHHFMYKKSQQIPPENADTIEDVRRKYLESIKGRNNTASFDSSNPNA